MKKLMIVFALTFLSSVVFAVPFYDVKIILQNGHEMVGLAQLPGNPGPSAIKFKESKNSRNRWVFPDSIKTVIYQVYGRTQEYDLLNVYTTPSHKIVQQYYLEVKQRGYVTLYSYVNMDVIVAMEFTRTTTNDCWACYRQGESVATTVSGTERKDKHGAFNEAANEYFKDDPALLAKINSGEYKWNDMEKIVEEYNRDKK
jgi:hypothetical protein